MNETGKTPPMTAEDVARERFEAYMKDKLRTEDDLSAWEFYTWLLKQAKQRKTDSSGYAPFAYQDDQETARKNRLAEQGGAA
jgi:hypothetical protein